MNKENSDPNVCILKRREAHLSASRSIPSIFRRRKRARSAQLELSNDQSVTKSSTTLRVTNPQKQAQTTRPVVETVNRHERSTFELTQRSMVCKSKCAASRSLNDQQGDSNLNEEGHPMACKDLRNSEDLDGIFSQEVEESATRTGEDGVNRVKVTEQRNALGTNYDNRDSQNFEGISNKDITQESDHSAALKRPESYACKALSHRQYN